MNFTGMLALTALMVPYAPWMGDGSFFHDLAGRRPDVPVSSLAKHAYEESQGQMAANDSGMLVCQANVGNLSTDWVLPVVGTKYAKTDLGLIITVKQGHGWQELILASGPDNTGTAFFFLPNVDLSKKYDLTVEAFDRDIYRNSKLETFTVSPQIGNQWQYQSKIVAIKCQAMPSWLMGQYISQQKEQFTMQIKEVKKTISYSLNDSVLTSLKAYLRPLHENIKELAGLLGWKSDQVQQLLDNLSPEEARLKKLILDTFDSRLLKSQSQITIGGLEISYLGRTEYQAIPAYMQGDIPFYSQMAPENLFLRIKITNKNSEAADISDISIGNSNQPIIIKSDGTNDFPRLTFYKNGAKWQKVPFGYQLAPGKSAEFLLIPSVNEELLTKESMPLLMRMAEPDSFNEFQFLLLK